MLDARPGIAATIRALSGRTGVTIDPDVVVRRLGPPLRHELSQWFPAPIVSQAVRVYRRLYPRFAYDAARPMPFAAEALAAVQRRGGRTVVITAKLERFAQVHVERMGWPVDQVVGDRFGTGKAEAISETGVAAYLGDHEADVAAARQAGVTALGVATGVSSRSALAAAGADAVFDDLAQFVAWLDGPPARSG